MYGLAPIIILEQKRLAACLEAGWSIRSGGKRRRDVMRIYVDMEKMVELAPVLGEAGCYIIYVYLWNVGLDICELSDLRNEDAGNYN
jgi:hypothetical protein